AYVRHRMAVAGRADRVFTDGAVRAVYRLSRGIPRLINVICDRALLGAYTRDRSRVDGPTARRAAAEVLGRRTGWLSGRRRRMLAAGLLALGAGAALVLLLPGEAGRRGPGVERDSGAATSLAEGRSLGSFRPPPAVGRATPAVGPDATPAVGRATPAVGSDATRAGVPARAAPSLPDFLKDGSRAASLRDAFGSLL